MDGRWIAVLMAMSFACGGAVTNAATPTDPKPPDREVPATASEGPDLSASPPETDSAGAPPASALDTATAKTNATPAPSNPARERVLFDFGAKDAGRAEAPTREVEDALLLRFPHPHAEGHRCDPNAPGTPPDERMRGSLLPTITQVGGAFTRANAAEIAFVIDYCPSGLGVPRTRRLLIIEAGSVTLDHEFTEDEPFEEVVSASDIDGDGRAELLVTTSIYRKGRVMIDASLLALPSGKPTVLAAWRAIKHCVAGVDQKTTRKIHVRMRRGKPAFRDEVETSRCYHQPARP